MTDGFTVDPAFLDGHATEVDGLAEQMRRVVEAGTPLDLDAYGLIGQVFARSAAEATRSGATTVRGLHEQIIALADAVRRSSALYLEAESRSVDTLRGIR